jgi:hypothetical protein
LATRSVNLDGRRYVWTGNVWYEAETFLTPPTTTIRRLNAALAESMVAMVAKGGGAPSSDELLQLAKKAQEVGGQLERALSLA